MRIRDGIAVILLAGGAGVAFATASTGAKYVRSDAIMPRDTMRAGHGGETKAEITHRSSESSSTEMIRQKKTLALLLLMLRDGRGAR